ncbi:ROK family transcriptional regulator [Martelella endophytica]|uniref:ROK family transcriptional regulator n=1 Tax=Martelella endophytica TaxID=1486262 RepID=UPI0005F20A5E|nr:ROK family transcriptional regulator [Martelella endophytica]
MPEQAPPPILRQISTRAMMKVLLEQGPTSRAELAKITGFSKQTTSEVVRALEENGYVRKKGIDSGKVGSPAIIYEVADEAGYALGIDAGASTIRASLVTLSSRIAGEITVQSDPRGGRELVAQLGSVKRRLIDETGISPAALRVVSLAMPGSVDPNTGAISHAYAVPEIDRFDVFAALQEEFDCELLMENDINAAAVGEYWNGDAKGAESLAFLSIGTGIGIGMLINGQLWRGATGAAGEIAYLPIGSDPASPLCPERGALELAIGAPAIAHRYRLAGGTGEASVKDIFDRCAAGERAAVATVEESARIASLSVLSVVAMFDPAEIIIGGNIGRRPEMSERIIQYLPQFTHRKIKLTVSALGPRATMMGAVALGLNHMHDRLFNLQSLPASLGLPVGKGTGRERGDYQKTGNL